MGNTSDHLAGGTTVDDFVRITRSFVPRGR
jgi:hypothetical protein